MSNDRIMTEEQLKDYVGSSKKSRQIQWLKDNGIPFRVKVTGHPVVLWADIGGRKHDAEDNAGSWFSNAVKHKYGTQTV